MQRYLLIADGDSLMAERIKSYFKSRGYRVELATGALECIELMQGELPDVLVLDCGLLWGGCDGLFEWMKDDQVRSRIPVVMMTEHSCKKIHHSAIIRRLYRPFNVAELFAEVNAAITLTSQGPEAISCEPKPSSRLQLQSQFDVPDLNAVAP